MKEFNYITCIVTYNRSSYLKKCLPSVCNQSIKPQKVIIVDNNSTDDTCNVVDDFKSSTEIEIHYVKMPENGGGAGGFKEAIRLSLKEDTDWVWLMDDDVEPVPTCLEEMSKATDKADVIQPWRQYKDGSFVKSECKQLNLSNAFKDLKIDFVKPEDKHEQNFEIACVPFEGPLIKKSKLKEAGLPLSKFFILCDDTEYSIRLKKCGAKFQLATSALMYRLIKPSQEAGQFDWKSYYYIRNPMIIDNIHGTASVRILRPIFLMIHYLLSGIKHRRKWSDIFLPIKCYKDSKNGNNFS